MLYGCDIETGPLPDEELLRFWEEPKKPGDFDPASVDVGRATKKETIDGKIAEAHRTHDAMLADWQGYVTKARDAWLDGVRKKAALSPATGRVLAVGFAWFGDGQWRITTIDSPHNEASVLTDAWDFMDAEVDEDGVFAWHNGYGFDLPFLLRRSWILGIAVPEWVANFSSGRPRFDASQVDTMVKWAMGDLRTYTKLNALAAAFSLGQKDEGCSGAEFADMYLDESTRDAALAYLKQDCILTGQVAMHMGM
jgi:hypothetical protein